MIYTFYSFKGGVGRSMALANVAELLYRCGLKVLIVDFDLEAPGLELFFDVPKAINKPTDVLAKSGLIDLLVSYKKLYGLPLPSSNDISKDSETQSILSSPAPPLSNFIVTIYKEKATSGSLEIIPSGKRVKEEGEGEGEADENYSKNYARTVRSFDWDDFYEKYDGEKFFEWFRREIESRADVVLVDSRTGITEIGGICTHQLADVVVIMVGTNEQNIDGSKMVAESLTNRNSIINKARNNRELSVLFVPSRVERSEKKSLDYFESLFKTNFNHFVSSDLEFEINSFADLTIPYVPYYAFQETIIDLEDIKASDADLLKAYERLTSTLMQLVPKDEPFYEKALKLGKKLLHGNHPSQILSIEKLAKHYQSQGLHTLAADNYLEVIERRKRLLGNEHPEVVISLENLAELYKSQGLFSEAESIFRQAREITRKLSSKSGWEEVIG